MKKNVLMYFDLINSFKTTQEVADFVSEIDTFMLTFSKEEMSMERALSSIGTDSARKIMEVFSKNKLDIKDKDAIRVFFDTLKELLKKFKVIKLVMAFDPTLKTIEIIHNFISNNIGIGYILDIEVDKSLLGGSIIMFNGKYSDFTVIKSLEETFALKKKEILQFYK